MRKAKGAASHVRTLPPLPRDLVARVLRQVRLSLRAGNADRAIAAIRDNLSGEKVERGNVNAVPLAMVLSDVLAVSNCVLLVRCEQIGSATAAKIREEISRYVERWSELQEVFDVEDA